MKPSYLALLAAGLLVASSSPVAAEPFDLPGTLLIRPIRPAPSDQRFELGLLLEIAPIKALAKERMRQIEEENPQFKEVMEVVREIPPETMQDLDIAEIKKQLLDLPGVKDDPKLSEAVEDIPEDEKTQKQLVAVAELLGDREESIAFAVRPRLRVNLDALMLTAEVPLAGFRLEDETNFVLGNLNLDSRLGWRKESGVVGLGLGCGVHLFVPTASERANVLTYSNVLNAPRYLREYFTPAAYVQAGLEAVILRLVAQAELVPMFAVKGDARRSRVIYGRFGVGAQLLLALLRVNAEIAKTLSFENAEALDTVYVGAGAYLDLSVLQLGAQLQMPLGAADGAAAAGMEGADIGEVSKLNVMIVAAFSL